MSKVTPENIKSLNASISSESAEELASAIQVLMQASSRGQINSNNLNRRSSNIIFNQKTETYDHITNRAPVFSAKIFDDSNLSMDFVRRLDISHVRNFKRQVSSFTNGDSTDAWELSYEDGEITTVVGGQKSTIDHVDGVWGFIKRVFKRIGLSLWVFYISFYILETF